MRFVRVGWIFCFYLVETVLSRGRDCGSNLSFCLCKREESLQMMRETFLLASTVMVSGSIDQDYWRENMQLGLYTYIYMYLMIRMYSHKRENNINR